MIQREEAEVLKRMRAVTAHSDRLGTKVIVNGALIRVVKKEAVAEAAAKRDRAAARLRGGVNKLLTRRRKAPKLFTAAAGAMIASTFDGTEAGAVRRGVVRAVEGAMKRGGPLEFGASPTATIAGRRHSDAPDEAASHSPPPFEVMTRETAPTLHMPDDDDDEDSDMDEGDSDGGGSSTNSEGGGAAPESGSGAAGDGPPAATGLAPRKGGGRPSSVRSAYDVREGAAATAPWPASGGGVRAAGPGARVPPRRRPATGAKQLLRRPPRGATSPAAASGGATTAGGPARSRAAVRGVGRGGAAASLPSFNVASGADDPRDLLLVPSKDPPELYALVGAPAKRAHPLDEDATRAVRGAPGAAVGAGGTISVEDALRGRINAAASSGGGGGGGIGAAGAIAAGLVGDGGGEKMTSVLGVLFKLKRKMRAREARLHAKKTELVPMGAVGVSRGQKLLRRGFELRQVRRIAFDWILLELNWCDFF